MKLIIFMSAIVVIGRLLIQPRLNLPTSEGCYESFAHLFVGGLFGAWTTTTDWKRYRFPWCTALDCHQVAIPCLNCFLKNWWYRCESVYFLLAISLSLFELVMFLIQKFA